MKGIRAIKIWYFDTEKNPSYEEFPEDRTVTITAEVTFSEIIVWK